jgi:Cornifin (SPRR) family
VQASLVLGSPACALFVTTTNVEGDDITMQLCVLEPGASTCDKRLDLCFGFGASAVFSVKPIDSKLSEKVKVHLSGFTNPVNTLESVNNSDDDEDDEEELDELLDEDEEDDIDEEDEEEDEEDELKSNKKGENDKMKKVDDDDEDDDDDDDDEEEDDEEDDDDDDEEGDDDEDDDLDEDEDEDDEEEGISLHLPHQSQKQTHQPQPSAQKQAQPSAQKQAQPSSQKQPQPSAQKQPQPSAQKQAQPSAQKQAQPSSQKLPQPSAQKQSQPSAQKQAQSSVSVGEKRPREEEHVKSQPQRGSFTMSDDEAEEKVIAPSSTTPFRDSGKQGAAGKPAAKVAPHSAGPKPSNHHHNKQHPHGGNSSLKSFSKPYPQSAKK